MMLKPPIPANRGGVRSVGEPDHVCEMIVPLTEPSLLCAMMSLNFTQLVMPAKCHYGNSECLPTTRMPQPICTRDSRR